MMATQTLAVLAMLIARQLAAVQPAAMVLRALNLKRAMMVTRMPAVLVTPIVLQLAAVRLAVTALRALN